MDNFERLEDLMRKGWIVGPAYEARGGELREGFEAHRFKKNVPSIGTEPPDLEADTLSVLIDKMLSWEEAHDSIFEGVV